MGKFQKFGFNQELVDMNKIIATEDGSHTLQSGQFDVTYHSIHGAIQETETVFIQAALAYQSQFLNDIRILEIGFGTGLNALMTCLEADERQLNIEYVGVEAYPIKSAMVTQLNYPKLLNALEYQAHFEQMHQAVNQTVAVTPNFNFQLRVDLFEALDYEAAFDIIYYDAFAPNAQPELWEEAQLQKMYKALKAGGVLTTYCAKGAFKRLLKSIGFELHSLPGPKGKREMTRAVKPPLREVPLAD